MGEGPTFNPSQPPAEPQKPVDAATQQPAKESAKKAEPLTIAQIAEDARSYGVKLGKVFKCQEGVTFDQVEAAKKWPEEIEGSDFFVAEAIRKNNKGADEVVVYKVRKKPDPRGQGENEVAFYKNFRDKLLGALPKDLRNKTTMVSLVKSPKDGEYQYHPVVGDPENRPSFLINKFDGQALGEFHHVSSDILGRISRDDLRADLYAVADFIKVMQSEGTKIHVKSIDNPTIEKSPFKFTGDTKGSEKVDMFSKYRSNIGGRRDGLVAAFGEEGTKKIEKDLNDILDRNTSIIATLPYVFTHGNMNFADILMNQDGQLCMLDWERVCASNNAAHDYALLLATLRDFPDLQKDFFNHILKKNADIDHFKEQLRMAYLFSRGIGELKDWAKKLRDAQTEDKKAFCQAILAKDAKVYKDAIDKTGIWAD